VDYNELYIYIYSAHVSSSFSFFLSRRLSGSTYEELFMIQSAIGRVVMLAHTTVVLPPPPCCYRRRASQRWDRVRFVGKRAVKEREKAFCILLHPSQREKLKPPPFAGRVDPFRGGWHWFLRRWTGKGRIESRDVRLDRFTSPVLENASSMLGPLLAISSSSSLGNASSSSSSSHRVSAVQFDFLETSRLLKLWLLM